MAVSVPVRLRTFTHADTNTMVSNILAVWHRATDDQRERGRHWYRIAHDLAKTMACGDARKGAGVIAALSAQTPWLRNIRQASALCAGEPVVNVRDRLDKARRILVGEDPLRVLPAGLKTMHFYQCIADPDDHRSVVIDRHAHDIAVGARYGNTDRGLSYRPRYELFAQAYRLAALRVHVLPSVIQATTWLVWTEERAASDPTRKTHLRDPRPTTSATRTA
ncbi:DUF7178 family protein [Streptantibioticus ferralitis]|uniref:Uncharacterized protein n=1 Tax=Streptantibioticus ferralitis TaxID=236510 RepID=A0ABT5Z3G4_9ACTN|nr:hypothetical protein [Streptantibioticus ferralitis]MDF2258365.1 hypothetical protein [Streptantibioticus ferralitis]